MAVHEVDMIARAGSGAADRRPEARLVHAAPDRTRACLGGMHRNCIRLIVQRGVGKRQVFAVMQLLRRAALLLRPELRLGLAMPVPLASVSSMTSLNCWNDTGAGWTDPPLDWRLRAVLAERGAARGDVIVHLASRGLDGFELRLLPWARLHPVASLGVALLASEPLVVACPARGEAASPLAVLLAAGLACVRAAQGIARVDEMAIGSDEPVLHRLAGLSSGRVEFSAAHRRLSNWLLAPARLAAIADVDGACELGWLCRQLLADPVSGGSATRRSPRAAAIEARGLAVLGLARSQADPAQASAHLAAALGSALSASDGCRRAGEADGAAWCDLLAARIAIASAGHGEHRETLGTVGGLLDGSTGHFIRMGDVHGRVRGAELRRKLAEAASALALKQVAKPRHDQAPPPVRPPFRRDPAPSANVVALGGRRDQPPRRSGA